MPIFLREYGPAVAFGIPGMLMFIATIIFWMGRKQYVRVPPAASDPDSFLHVARTALLAQGPGRGGRAWSSPRSARALADRLLLAGLIAPSVVAGGLAS